MLFLRGYHIIHISPPLKHLDLIAVETIRVLVRLVAIILWNSVDKA